MEIKIKNAILCLVKHEWTSCNVETGTINLVNDSQIGKYTKGETPKRIAHPSMIYIPKGKTIHFRNLNNLYVDYCYYENEETLTRNTVGIASYGGTILGGNYYQLGGSNVFSLKNETNYEWFAFGFAGASGSMATAPEIDPTDYSNIEYYVE